jgi:hypothetical protein
MYSYYHKSTILQTDLLDLDVSQFDDICDVIYVSTVTERRDYIFTSFFANKFTEKHIQQISSKLLTMNFGKLFIELLNHTIFIPTKHDINEFVKNQRSFKNTYDIIVYVVSHSKCPLWVYEKNELLANISR